MSTTTPGMHRAAIYLGDTQAVARRGISHVNDALSMLRGNWTGEASASFDRSMTSWMSDCQHIIQKLGEMIQVMESNRQVITAGERANADTARGIPTGPGLDLVAGVRLRDDLAPLRPETLPSAPGSDLIAGVRLREDLAPLQPETLPSTPGRPATPEHLPTPANNPATGVSDDTTNAFVRSSHSTPATDIGTPHGVLTPATDSIPAEYPRQAEHLPTPGVPPTPGSPPVPAAAAIPAMPGIPPIPAAPAIPAIPAMPGVPPIPAIPPIPAAPAIPAMPDTIRLAFVDPITGVATPLVSDELRNEMRTN
ncbi:WXG100 family type VII secretion target [Lentzea sp.]|uniref:WXG100 family type VII secretion target n=1 Tax=Lentzea sp. TaxID=56099 RepID=UPI002ED000CF